MKAFTSFALLTFLLVSTLAITTRAQSATFITIPAGTSPGPIVYDSGKGEFFVADTELTHNVVVISDTSNTVIANISITNHTASISDLAYDPAKGEVFVSYTIGTVSTQTYVMVAAISDSTDKIAANITIGIMPSSKLGTTLAMAYDSAKGEIFVAVEANNTVSAISDSSNSVTATVPVGNQPSGVAYDSANGDIFVTDYGQPFDTVSVISDSTNEVVKNVTVGAEPYQIVYDSVKGELFVSGTGKVMVIPDSSNTATLNITMPDPKGMAFDPSNGEVFVADGNQAYVISDQNDAILGTIISSSEPVQDGVEYAAFDSATSEVAFSDYQTNAVYLVSASALISSSSVVTSPPSTSSSSSVSHTSSQSSSTSKGGGVPEFPFSVVTTIVVTIIIVFSYLLFTRRKNITRL